MSRRIAKALAISLLTTAAASALAAEAPVSASKVEDVLYKGIVGKALDVVPMDPEHRAGLQRTNAVVSNTITGRSLSIWAGLTNPVLLIGGMAWGFFAASNIKSEALPKGRAPVEARVPVMIERAPGNSAVALQAAEVPQSDTLVAVSGQSR